MTEPASRNRDVQALRGVAALLVVLLHAHNAIAAHGGGASLFSRLLLRDHFGSLGVDLFFVISGAVMALTMERGGAPGAFLMARYRRVMPFFWIASLFTVATGFLVGDRPYRGAMLNSITLFPMFDTRIATMPLPAVGWTLAFELYFYAVVALALALPRAMRRDAVTAVLAGGAVAGWLLAPIAFAPLAIACNPILLEFLFGLWAVRLAQMRAVQAHGGAVAALGAALLTIGAITGYGFSSAPEDALSAMASLDRVAVWGAPSALVLIGLFARGDGTGRPGPLARLGDASYALYLAHPALFLLITRLWPWWGPLGCDLLLALLILSAILFGGAVHLLVERPLLRTLRGPPIGERRRPFGELAIPQPD